MLLYVCLQNDHKTVAQKCILSYWPAALLKRYSITNLFVAIHHIYNNNPTLLPKFLITAKYLTDYTNIKLFKERRSSRIRRNAGFTITDCFCLNHENQQKYSLLGCQLIIRVNVTIYTLKKICTAKG